jgi:hypothetical protein
VGIRVQGTQVTRLDGSAAWISATGWQQHWDATPIYPIWGWW